MIRFFAILICIFCLSGCGLFSFFDAPPSTPASPEKQVSPPAKQAPIHPQRQQAEQLLIQARRLWEESTICSDPRKAAALLTQVLRAAPEHPEALRLRALAYKDLKYWDGAEEDATKAVVIEPDALNYAVRSLVFSESGNFLGAEKDARRAMVMDQTLPTVLIAIAQVYFYNNDTAAACRSLQAACDRGECNPWKRSRDSGMCTDTTYPDQP